MATVRAQVIIPHVSALPEDVTINTFHFNALPDVDNVTLMGLLDQFYSVAAAPAVNSINNYLSPFLDLNGATVKLYDLEDPVPRVPYFTSGPRLWAPVNDGVPLPGEVAICCSIAGDLESGQIAARRRGRIFLGPLSLDAVATGADRVEPTAAFVTSITEAAKRMTQSEQPYWTIFSPTAALTTTPFLASTPVTNGWVDNAFDTMRSRGRAATSRTTWVR